MHRSCRRLTTVAILTVTAAAGAGLATAGQPADAELLRPLALRDMTPPAILTLGMAPTPAAVLPAGRWRLALTYSDSNIFLMSGAVRSYLEQRGRRSPLSRSEMLQLVATTPGDVFYFDGEIGVLDLSVSRGLGRHLELSLHAPFFTLTGGNFDSLVASFHRAVGLGTGGRDLVADDNFQVLMKLRNEVFMLTDAPGDGGLGDPSLVLRWELPEPAPGWSAALAGALKLPVGDPQQYLSNGHVDYGAQVLVERRWPRARLALGLSWVAVGNFELAHFDPASVPTFTAAYSHTLSRRWAGLAQLLVARSIFANQTSTALARREYQVSVGLRRLAGPRAYTFAVTENVVNYKNSPDIGVHTAVSWILD